MARQKSEEKRNTLLSVAAQVFARNGLSASTASITAAAGMAEGTLFVYFKGKDELINSVYSEIKTDLAEAMLSGHPKDGSVTEKMRLVWNNYVCWGAENPDKLAALNKIKLYENLKCEVDETTTQRFCYLHNLIEGAIAGGSLKDVPYEFMLATFAAQAEATMQFIHKDPDKTEFYRERGFEIFWNGITRTTTD